MKKTREERVADLLALDRELMARLQSATPAERPAIEKERTKIKSQMNLYGPAAVARWIRQQYPEIDDADRHEEERMKKRAERWAKNPELLKKIRKLAAEAAE
jgi:hypothetical protein